MAKRPKQTSDDPTAAPTDPGAESDALLDAAGQSGAPAEIAAPPAAPATEHPGMQTLRDEIAAHEAELKAIGDPYAEVTELNRRHDEAKQKLDEVASKLQVEVDRLFIDLRTLRESQIPIIDRMNLLKHYIAKKSDELRKLTAK